MRAASRFAVGLMIAGSVLFPLAANAQASGSIQQQIQALLAQVAVLTAQLQQLTTAPSTVQSVPAAPASPATSSAGVLCPTIARTLSLGASGDDVTSLQEFLNAQGMLGSGSMTGYFGALTQAAVGQWQGAHNVVSSGDASSTGFGVVGSKTRAAISSVCGGTLSSSATVGATLSLPGTGTNRTISATVTVNTHSSCAAQTYTLDWGDGSAPQSISVPHGMCAPLSQTIPHTYAEIGTYMVSIGSGANGATVQTTVSQAAPACVLPAFSFNSVPSGTLGTPYSLTLMSYADDPQSPMHFAVLGLPSGLLLEDVQSTSTGALMHNWVLSGTPTVATTSALTITAADSCGTARVALSVAVNASGFSIPSSSNTCPVVPISCGANQYIQNFSTANGCTASMCVNSSPGSTVLSCPNYNLPLCANGSLVAQGTDANGCQLPPLCVSGTTGTASTFSASPTSGNAPLTVTFTGVGTSISFGDGTGQAVSDGGTVGQTSYTYTTSGTYTAMSNGSPVTITVTSPNTLSCMMIDCAIGYHPSGPSCSFNQTCVPN